MKPHHRKLKNLKNAYGKTAVILGASEGIGRAFAIELATAGFDLVLASRREEPLTRLAGEIEKRFEVDVRTYPLDLSIPGEWRRIDEELESVDTGLVVYNAAASPIGPFLDHELESVQRTVSVNISSPLEILHRSGNRLRKRFVSTGRRGGVILLSSLSALRGTPHISAYAASKAWAMVLAQGVGQEAAGEGVDVLACVAGATDTPGYRDSLGDGPSVAPVQPSAAVAREALASLGRRNVVISGRMNRLVARVLYGYRSGKWSSVVLANATSKLRHRKDAGLDFPGSGPGSKSANKHGNTLSEKRASG